jgi:hypothetical protein
MNIIVKKIGAFILIMLVTYLFLSLCNWGFNLKEWNDFSRFILGAEGVVLLMRITEEI